MDWNVWKVYMMRVSRLYVVLWLVGWFDPGSRCMYEVWAREAMFCVESMNPCVATVNIKKEKSKSAGPSYM